MPINQYIDWIRNGFEKNTVEQIRFYGKGHPKYDQLKKQRWTVSFNFLFDEKKRNANIKCATGMMMFDLDAKEMLMHDFDVKQLNLDDIYILHKSVGGKGYTVIVKVDGLTLQNFKYNYNRIAEKLGLSQVMDTMARKATQYTVLSFDPDIYVNENSTVFQTEEEVVKKRKSSSSTTTTMLDWDYNLAQSNTNYTYASDQLRYDNLQDYIQDDQDYIYDYENGYNYVSVPYRYSYPINEGGRSMHLFSITVKIVWLNPQANLDTLRDYLFYVNDSCHIPPLRDAEVVKTLNYVYENKERFQPLVSAKPKKIIFNTKLDWSREEKMKVVYQLNADSKRNLSLMKLESIIELWNFEKEGKITQRAVYKHYEISKKTVEKYWYLYKEQIDLINSTSTTRL